MDDVMNMLDEGLAGTVELEREILDTMDRDQAAHTVNALMRDLRRITAELRQYESLHQVEIDRLKVLHEEHCLPLKERSDKVRLLLSAILQRHEITTMVTPNGTIRSRRVQPRKFRLTDETGGITWARQHGADEAVETKEHLRVGILTKIIDSAVEDGSIVPVIVHKTTGDILNAQVPQPLNRPFLAVEAGRFVEVESGEIIPGVGWTPNGTYGGGRNYDFDV